MQRQAGRKASYLLFIDSEFEVDVGARGEASCIAAYLVVGWPAVGYWIRERWAERCNNERWTNSISRRRWRCNMLLSALSMSTFVYMCILSFLSIYWSSFKGGACLLCKNMVGKVIGTLVASHPTELSVREIFVFVLCLMF